MSKKSSSKNPPLPILEDTTPPSSGEAPSREKMEALCQLYLKDFIRFAGRVLKVQSIDGKILPLIFNRPQKVLHSIVESIHAAGRPVRLIALKARRMGFSTYFSARNYHKTSWNPNRYATQVTHEPEATDALFKMVKRFYNFTPEWIRPSTLYNNTKLLEFNTKDGKGLNSGFRVATAEKDDFGSGQLINFLHLSECSKYPSQNIQSLLTSILQCVPDGLENEIVFESTGKGIGGEFYDRFWAARYRAWVDRQDENGSPLVKHTINEDADPDNNYTAVFLPWFIFELYELKPLPGFELTKEEKEIKARHNLRDGQIYWRRVTIANKCNGSIETFKQEYPACIVGGTRIGTVQGIIPMSEMGLAAMHGTICDFGPIHHFWKKGFKPVSKITTSMGYELTGTLDHLVATQDGDFAELGQLQGRAIILQPPTFSLEDQTVRIEQFQFMDSTIPITKDFARFVGYFMGDGSYCNDTLSIVCDSKDTDVINDVDYLFQKHFGEPGIRQVGTKKGGTEIRLQRKNLRDIFFQLGLIRHNGSQAVKRKVCIPEFIWRSPKDVIREFLRGLFEADGFADYQQARVNLFVSDEEFLKGIQLLLLGFGITCRYSNSRRRNGTGYEYDARELTLRAAEVKAFMRNVGFISKRKTDRQNSYLASVGRKDTHRNGRSLVDVELFDRVVSIEDAGIQEVFDITMSRDSNPWFGANGILVHNCPEEAFLGTGRPVFDVAKIQALMLAAPNPIARYECLTGVRQWMSKEDGRLQVWKEPQRGTHYIVSADVAEGLAHGDFSCADVIEHLTGKQVAHWHGKVDADEFGVILMCLAKRYNEAWLVPERNNHGLTTVTVIVNEDYPKVYCEMVPEPPGRPRKRYGWLTNGSTRPLIIDGLIKEIREGTHGIVCKDTFNEMLTFKVQDNGKLEADSGRFDDRVLSMAIGKHVRNFLELPSAGLPEHYKKQYRTGNRRVNHSKWT